MLLPQSSKWEEMEKDAEDFYRRPFYQTVYLEEDPRCGVAPLLTIMWLHVCRVESKYRTGNGIIGKYRTYTCIFRGILIGVNYCTYRPTEEKTRYAISSFPFRLNGILMFSVSLSTFSRRRMISHRRV